MTQADFQSWAAVAKRSWIDVTERIDGRAYVWRWILVGPLAFVVSILSLAALPHVLPEGAGGVNHLIVPTIILPVTWTAAIVWPVTTEKLATCLAVYTGLIFLCLLVVMAALL